MHPCEIIYEAAGRPSMLGSIFGTCRITGRENVPGMRFNEWVKDTFTDHGFLKPGNVISHPALFCFDEGSQLLQKKTGKEKPQRMRTYSHIVRKGEWFAIGKDNKQLMFDLIFEQAELVIIAESGQKHIIMKAVPGYWQYEAERPILPNLPLLATLQGAMRRLSDLGFAQDEIRTGRYISARIQKAGVENWQKEEAILRPHRGKQMFNFSMYFFKCEQKTIFQTASS